MAEILFFIALVACLVLPFIMFKLWWWVAMMAVIVLVVALFEGVAVLTSGKTLSQKFWKWSKVNKWRAWLVLGITTVGWLMLMAHLAAKMF